MEAGKLSIQDDVVQTAELLRHLVSVCATRAQTKGLTFSIEEAPPYPFPLWPTKPAAPKS